MRSLLPKIAMICLIVGAVAYSQINRANDMAKPQNSRNEAGQTAMERRQEDRQQEKNTGESNLRRVDVKPLFSLGPVASPPEKQDKTKSGKSE